ncbi:histidine kinase [Crocinitomicaceae bacterium]|nr:histidine kinase [Crocinitomicaceae bacterium]
MRICILTFTLLLCTQLHIISQIDFHYPFYKLGSKNGLPSTEVYMVKQDSKGLIWICSDGGVTKYDGHRLQTFTTSEGLTDNVVFDIYEDAKGRIWFITYNSELCYHDGKKIVTYPYNDVIKKNLKSYSNGKQLFVDKNDVVYYSIHESGFLQINNDGSYVRKNKEINAIEFIFDLNSVFVSHSLQRNTVPSSFPVTIYRNGKKKKVGNINEYVKRLKMVEGSVGKFAIVNNRLIEIESFKTVFKDNIINNAIQTDENTIWISTADGAVKLVRSDAEFKIEERILHDQFISSVNFDSNDGIWISSLTGGVYYTPNLSVEYASDEDGLVSNDVRDILYHDSSLYLSYSKFWQYVGKNGDVTTHKSTVLPPKFALLGNKVVVSSTTNNDIKNYRSNSTNIFLSPFRSMSIKGDKLYGALDRVYSFLLVDGNFIQDTLINKVKDEVQTSRSHFNTVCYTEEGLLVGGKDGLFKLNDGKLELYLGKGYDQDISIKQITNTNSWGIAVATYDRGLILLKNGSISRSWEGKNGLLSNQVKCVYESKEGILFIGTNYGLNYIVPGENTVRRISAENGMLGGNINAISESQEHILLGTTNGLYRIRKKSLQDLGQFRDEKIFLEGLKIDNEELDRLSQHVTYDYGTANIHISFRTVNYSNWMNKVYEYRLSRTDDWIRVYSPEISISRPKGDYEIEIRYMLGEGYWSEPKSLISLGEKVPFWAEPIFWIVLSVFLLILVVLWTRRQFKIREKRLVLANEVVSLQQRIKHVRLNPHFIFNVLNSIYGFVLFDEKKKAEKYLLKFSSVMRSFLTTSKEGILSLKEEMSMLREYIELESIRFEGKVSTDIEGETELNVLIPSMIIQPVVENALKYSTIGENNKKHIKVSIVKEQHILLVKVINSGIMSEENLERFTSNNDIHAIGINHKRLEYYCKIVKNEYLGMKAINDELSNQTEIWIRLPILKSYEDINS